MKQRGFTLVELAIVLMIIGLLIGGILKGQEMIANARITSTLRQIKSYDAAVWTFQDSYGALPGDMTNPGTRLPNCGATPVANPCNGAGNGNNQINVAPEYLNFWRHLAKANMISGINTEVDDIYPTPIAAIETAAIIATTNLYFNMYDRTDFTGGVFSAHQAAQIDRKMDDGLPSTGSVRAQYDGNAEAAPCINGTAYDERTKDPRSCLLFIIMR